MTNLSIFCPFLCSIDKILFSVSPEETARFCREVAFFPLFISFRSAMTSTQKDGKLTDIKERTLDALAKLPGCYMFQICAVHAYFEIKYVHFQGKPIRHFHFCATSN